MQYQVSASFNYAVLEPSTILLSHLVHPGGQKLIQESMVVNPQINWEELLIGTQKNRICRLNPAVAGELQVNYSARVETNYSVIDFSVTDATPVSSIDQSIFPYLYPSRYCQSDKLTRLATHEFGKIDNLFDKVVAITDWIFDHVEYLSGSTSSETSAYDTVTQQAGVCRDFAHLGIALCRALTIPARYCAVYANQLIPQDFHACFEAYISGKWVIFDATKLVPLNGMVKIAMGRDAGDTAVSNLFGNIIGNMIEVDCQVAEGDFQPFYYNREFLLGIVYG